MNGFTHTNKLSDRCLHGGGSQLLPCHSRTKKVVDNIRVL